MLKSAIMTVTIELKPEIEKALHEKALSDGIDVDVYLERLVERDIEEQEILAFFKEVREEVYQEKLKAKMSRGNKRSRR